MRDIKEMLERGRRSFGSKKNAKCPICDRPIATGERNPDVDYCHGHTEKEWEKQKQK